MFLMKSRCPGASMMVMVYFWVLNFSSEMSMVIPRSRSAFSLSSTQANLKELFPICTSGHDLKLRPPELWVLHMCVLTCAALFSNLSSLLWSMPPHL